MMTRDQIVALVDQANANVEKSEAVLRDLQDLFQDLGERVNVANDGVRDAMRLRRKAIALLEKYDEVQT